MKKVKPKAKSQSETGQNALPSQMAQRKLEHIKIVLEENVEPIPSDFDKYRLKWRALPELDFAKIDTAAGFLGFRLKMPFLIASMTGGPQKAAVINRNLAIAAQECGVALGLGSTRIILREPAAVKSFQVKKYCPNVPVLANIGLVQLNYGVGLEEILKIVELTQADGLIFHLNHLQEVVQPEGDTNFAGLCEKLAQILPKIPVPVVVKEVGAGVEAESARMLKEAGVEWVDVAGLGGTSWTAVEGFRRTDSASNYQNLGQVFAELGISTPLAIKEVSKVTALNPQTGKQESLKVIASGGLRSGLDMAKSLALGASITSLAKPLLEPALESPQSCVNYIKKLEFELKVGMFAVAAAKISDLRGKIEVQS